MRVPKVRAVRALATAMLVLALALAGCAGSDEASSTPSRPHAVLVVLDEFPSDTLLGPEGGIDAGRYPNFAALAGDSTWFRNAYTAYDSTTKAVPLILDGIRPQRGTAPTARDHPRSIITALGRRGYRIATFEEGTALCPRRYCPGKPTRRPAIVPNLKGGARSASVRSSARSGRVSARPSG